MFDGVRPALAGRTRLLTPDLRGFGGGPPLDPAAAPDLSVFADDVLADLDAAGIGRAVVGGVSMGGYIALNLLRRHPDRIAGLVLADTRSGADDAAALDRRRGAAERAGDLRGDLDRVDQVLAGHLVVDAERDPAHRPVRLPLQLHMAAGDGRDEALLRVGIGPGDGAGLDIDLVDRHLHDDARLRVDRQEGRIGRGPLLAQRRQHDLHHGVVARQHLEQRRVELAGAIRVGRGLELVVEAEAVEEGAEPGVVVAAERVMRAERVRHLGQRLAEIGREQFLVRHVVRHLAQAVHVVGEGDEPGRDGVAGQHLEGVADHRGPRDLAEGADMWQARGAVAGFKDHRFLAGFLDAGHELARLLERPGGRTLGGVNEGCVEGGHEGRCPLLIEKPYRKSEEGAFADCEGRRQCEKVVKCGKRGCGPHAKRLAGSA